MQVAKTQQDDNSKRRERPSRVLKNPVLDKNDDFSMHEIGVNFHRFTPFSAPC